MRIASGDRLAMKVLFSRHQVRVYRFVLRLVRDETLAEDVISDVFMDLWRQADRFEARASVATWLLAIALQLVLWGQYLDIAVRDTVMALGGALILARLARFESHRARTTS